MSILEDGKRRRFAFRRPRDDNGNFEVEGNTFSAIQRSQLDNQFLVHPRAVHFALTFPS